MRILLVEDDQYLGEALKNGLKQEGYTIDWLEDGLAAEQALKTDEFDLVVLDLGLPKKPGLEVLKGARLQGITTPVLVLTAKDAIDDRVAGLDAGADDYLAKPFSLEEVSARARALIRRSKGRANPVIEFEDIVLDPAAHNVKKAGEIIDLPRREFVLFRLLLDNLGKVVTRHQLLNALYGWGEEVDSNALEVHIHHLRKKFGSELIKTVRGVGYTINTRR